MAVQPHRRQRRSIFWPLLLVGMFLMLATGGTTASLWLMGVDFGFAQAADPPALNIPINVRPLEAYSKVSRSDLLDPETGWLRYQRLPPASAVGMGIQAMGSDGLIEGTVKEVLIQDGEVVFVTDVGRVSQSQTAVLGGVLLDPNAIIGRVVKRDRPAGLGFREDNFFPVGTPEGVAGATPPGMRSMVIAAEKLDGIYTLPAGARIDLLANVPTDDMASFDRSYNSRLPGAALVLSAKSDSNKQRGATEPVMLAQEAVILKPVYQRSKAVASSTLTQGQRVQQVPVYEVALAVRPGDVIPIQSALSKELDIVCVAHSMQEGELAGGVVEIVTEDQVLAPVTARAVLAYEPLSYEYFENAANRELQLQAVSREAAERMQIVTSIDELIGVVVKHDIPKGSYLTRSDILTSPTSSVGRLEKQARDGASKFQFASEQIDELSPGQLSSSNSSESFASLVKQANSLTTEKRPSVAGAAPGVSTFLPAGHRAVSVPWSRLYGAEHLQIGDVVDLTASYSLRHDAEVQEQERRPDGTVVQRTMNQRVNEPTQRPYAATLGFRGEPWFAAVDAKVIAPVGYPPPAAASRFLGKSLYDENGDDSGPPVVFAIAEADLEAMTAALASEDAKFSVLIHRAGSGDSSGTSNPSPETPVGFRRIVICAQGLNAYAELRPDDLEAAHTRRVPTRLVRADDPAFTDALTPRELSFFTGRILRQYKSPKSFFTAADFLPPGAKPGLAAAARAGHVVVVVADDEIEGIAQFHSGDEITVLLRSLKSVPQNVVLHSPGGQLDDRWPVAETVVPVATIVRQSEGEETILEIPATFVARFQAARSSAIVQPDRANQATTDEDDNRSDQINQLVAVALPRVSGSNAEELLEPVPSPVAEAVPTPSAEIQPYNPLQGLHTTEAVRAGRREVHVFAPAESAKALRGSGGASPNASTSNEGGK